MPIPAQASRWWQVVLICSHVRMFVHTLIWSRWTYCK